MSALSRSPLARGALSAVSVAVWAYAVWRLTGGADGTAQAMTAVLAWGLGLMPVHVTLRLPQPAGGGRSVRRIGGAGDHGRGPTGRQGKGDRRLRRYGRD